MIRTQDSGSCVCLDRLRNADALHSLRDLSEISVGSQASLYEV
jgi:hypothetical protein